MCGISAVFRGVLQGMFQEGSSFGGYCVALVRELY